MIDESKNLKKLLERGSLFDEIKYSVTPIEASAANHPSENQEEDTDYEALVKEILGD